MLSYILDDNECINSIIKIIAQQTGLRVVTVKAQTGHIDDLLPLISVEQWISLIYYAKFVITDSFHGTVFSILYHKPFYTFSRTGVKESMDTRVVSLLKLLELTDRFEPENITLDGVEQIDFGKSKIILDREKKRAIEYIEGISK